MSQEHQHLCGLAAFATAIIAAELMKRGFHPPTEEAEPNLNLWVNDAGESAKTVLKQKYLSECFNDETR